MHSSDVKIGVAVEVVSTGKRGVIVEQKEKRIDAASIQDMVLVVESDGNQAWVSVSHVVPLFEVGDTAIVQNNYEGTIWGIAPEKDASNKIYGVSIKDHEGYVRNVIVSAGDLDPVPEFKDLDHRYDVIGNAGQKMRIIARGDDGYEDEVVYFVKVLEGRFEGLLKTITASNIKKVVGCRE